MWVLIITIFYNGQSPSVNSVSNFETIAACQATAAVYKSEVSKTNKYAELILICGKQ